MNTCIKRLKAFLVLRVRNIDFSIALKHVEISNLLFFNFLDLDKFMTVSLALPPSLTTSLFLARNTFGADNLDDLVVFNLEVVI